MDGWLRRRDGRFSPGTNIRFPLYRRFGSPSANPFGTEILISNSFLYKQNPALCLQENISQLQFVYVPEL